jgi:RNA polymerase sigma factor (sigma-70 family)
MSKTINLHSDESLIRLIKQKDESAFTQVYKNCKEYCINFLKKNGADHEIALDIFQDSMIIFYEKAIGSHFELKCSIQTYLNSICRNKWLNTIRDTKEIVVSEDFSFEENITDWFEDFDDEREQQIEKIKKALEKMDEGGGKCKEILMLYFYENKSMGEIATHFGYTNADNAKNQKARCQKKLKEMVTE